MKLVITVGAKRSLDRVAKYIEDQNTEGAGDRWLDTLMYKLIHISEISVKHAICRYPPFARKNLRCFTYNKKWVVAYKISADRFTIHRFVLGSKLI